MKSVLSKWVLMPYHFYVFLKQIPSFFKRLSISPPTNKEFVQQYNAWLKKKSNFRLEKIGDLNTKEWLPTLGVLVVVSESSLGFLIKTVESFRNIQYPNKLISIGIGSSDEKENRFLVKRIKEVLDQENEYVVGENVVIGEAGAFNEAFKIQKTDYVICVKSGDELEPHCFASIASTIIKNPSLDVVYFDEGKVNSKGIKHIPNFKPSWSPDLFLSHNYLGHGVMFRSSLFASLGKLNPSFSSAYLFDYLLKMTEVTSNICHLPEVMYHRKSLFEKVDRVTEEKQAIEQALIRRNESAKVYVNDERKRTYLVRYKLKRKDKVSIIIPSRDQGEILDNCLKSVFEKTEYDNYEIIIVDNGSTEERFFEVIDYWKNEFEDRFKIMKADIPFNFAKLNNLAAEEATGEYLLFLNNDVEVMTPEWLTGMVEHAQRESAGAIGVKLLFPNDEIQHAGVILGVDGISTHPFARQTSEESHFFVDNIVNYSALTGACLMVEKNVFEEVGGFDEKYVVEFNDFDLCLRIKQAGYNNIYVPHVMLYHYESYSRGKKHKNVQGFMRYRNERDMFVQQWGEYIKNDPIYNPNLQKDSDQIFEPKLD